MEIDLVCSVHPKQILSASLNGRGEFEVEPCPECIETAHVEGQEAGDEAGYERGFNDGQNEADKAERP